MRRIASGSGRHGLALALALAAVVGLPGAASAQIPDSLPPIPPDTLQLPPDTVPADTLAADPTGVEVLELDQGTPADTVQATPPDSVVRTLPALTPGVPGRREAGVTVWDTDDLLGNRALTLLELLAQEPDLLPLRHGDFGAPESVLGPGMAGGRVRVFTDGYEMIALDGANLDLARIPLGGVAEVRVERAAGELIVHLTSLQPVDGRPMSRVEAGTGDLDTNIFRGAFVHPRALGGSLGVTIERLDSQGPQGDEPGARQGVWLRYALHRGDGMALSVDWRRSSADLEFGTPGLIPTPITRSDWTVRGRARLLDPLTAELFIGNASLTAEPDGFTPLDRTLRQTGARLAFETSPLEGGRVWANGSARFLSGSELPSRRIDLVAGAELERFGGVAVDVRRDAWLGEAANASGIRAWTTPVFGVSLFGSRDSGRRGAERFGPRLEIPDVPADDGTGDGGTGDGGTGDGGTGDSEPVESPVGFTERTSTRFGARVDLGPIDVTAARLRVETDSLRSPFSLVTRDVVAVPGDVAEGWEVSGRVGLPLIDGLGVAGTLMQWDAEGPWRPRRRYTGGLDFANTYYPSRSLEIRAQLQVEGRDPMLIPQIDPEAATTDPETGDPLPPAYLRVPFQQSWNAWLHIRVQSVRIFVRWENLFLRPANQDFPERLLPRTRAVYGVRWTLWN